MTTFNDIVDRYYDQELLRIRRTAANVLAFTFSNFELFVELENGYFDNIGYQAHNHLIGSQLEDVLIVRGSLVHGNESYSLNTHPVYGMMVIRLTHDHEFRCRFFRRSDNNVTILVWNIYEEVSLNV